MSTDSSAGSFARIELRAAHRWTPPQSEPESRLTLFAVFVQHLGLDEDVAAAHVGLAPEAPPLGPRECRLLGSVPKQDALAGVGEGEDSTLVELLDAGALWVVLPQASTLVRPSLYPDVLPHVSGVQYRTTLSREGLSLRHVTIQGFGGADVGTFEWLRREGPVEFRIQQVADSPPTDAPFAVRATTPLALRWAPAGSADEVRVRLLWDPGPTGTPTGLECRPSRPGRHVFSPTDLARVGAGVRGRDITLQVVATRQESMRLPDGMPATFVLSQSDSVILTLTP